MREDITASVFITGNWTIKKYDEMFYHTVAEDTEETAVELALNRLRFPAGIVGEEQKCLQNIHTGAYGQRWQRILVKQRRYRRNPVPGAEEAVE